MHRYISAAESASAIPEKATPGTDEEAKAVELEVRVAQVHD